MSKKSLYQLFEDGDLSEKNCELYKTVTEYALQWMYRYISITISDKSFQQEYNKQLPSEYHKSDHMGSQMTTSIEKTRNNISTELILTPLIKKNTSYIFAETIVIDGTNGAMFKEFHYILFPIQFLEFTNELININHFMHEYDEHHLLGTHIVKLINYDSFEPDESVVKQLAESFKDVFL